MGNMKKKGRRKKLEITALLYLRWGRPKIMGRILQKRCGPASNKAGPSQRNGQKGEEREEIGKKYVDFFGLS